MDLVVTFGMAMDGAEWSDGKASLGELKAGPLLMLDFLETRLGLGGDRLSAPERINQYMRKIDRKKPAWCLGSFELDRWSTAKVLLAWRDELYDNGWDGRTTGTPRLEALAALEADEGALDPGVPDRLKRVWEALSGCDFSGAAFRLRENLDALPYWWKRIFTRLRDDCRAAVDFPAKDASAGTGADPGIYWLNAEDEFALARECARYLASGSGEDNRRVAVICEGGSSVLDAALRRAGLGGLGLAERSRWRESLQVLPLWLDTLWKPFSPQRFLELLELPASPVPGELRLALTAALQEEPGRGGKKWQEAMTGFTAKDDSEKTVFALLRDECFKAGDTVRAEQVSRWCDILIGRIAAYTGRFPGLKLAASHAKTLQKIVAERENIGRVELARIVDSIISIGTTGELPEGEVNDFAVFSSPGMIDRSFDTVIWWACVERGKTAATNWTAAEIAAMPGFGRKTMREREAGAWENARRRAAKSLVVMVPATRNGEAATGHPFLDVLNVDDDDKLTPDKLCDASGNWSFAGRSCKLEAIRPCTPAIVPTIRPDEKLKPKSLSYSQLEMLLACPRRWFLEKHLGLKNPPAMDVPSGPLMLGTLAHKVVEKLYADREQLDDAAAAGREAGTLFDELLPSMAAELLLPGRDLERRRYRATLVRAVEELVKCINSLGLRVKGCEKNCDKVIFGDINFQGRMDMLLEDRQGRPFVIDLKWSDKGYYEEALRAGRALQLASYAWLLDGRDLAVRCAYFLFPQHKFIPAPENHDWKQLWDAACATYGQCIGDLRSGRLVRGVEDVRKSDRQFPVAAACPYCKCKPFCDAMKED